MTTVIVSVAVLAVAGLTAVWVIGVRQGLLQLRRLVGQSWAQIAEELARRHDLVPHLVATVAAVAPAERAVLDDVSAACAVAAAPGAPVGAQAAAETALSAALGRLFRAAEAYPALLADQSFQDLRAELAETEDRVAAGRRFYNATVRELNTRVDRFPSKLFASASGIHPAEPFQTTSPPTPVIM